MVIPVEAPEIPSAVLTAELKTEELEVITEDGAAALT
jgi:hypothetical protein